MSFVPTLQKNFPMRRRSFFFPSQKLLWLALVLSISLCHQAAFASALSQLAASMQPGQFAELTGMNGFNNGNIMAALGCSPGDHITEYANKAVWNSIAKRFQFVGAPHGSACLDSLITVFYDEAQIHGLLGPKLCDSDVAHAYDHNAINPATGEHYYRQYNSTAYIQAYQRRSLHGLTIAITSVGEPPVLRRSGIFPRPGTPDFHRR